MKVTRIFPWAFSVLFLALISCSSENEQVSVEQRDVSFSSTLNGVNHETTRLDVWTGAENVGVFMYQDANALASNVQYSVSAEGNLTATSDGIMYPITGNVSFKAVYPYVAVSDATVAIDLSTEGDHDFMYATPSQKFNNASTGSVSLNFKHQLGRLSLTIADKTIKDAVYTVHATVDATFTVADGTLALGTTKMDLTPATTESTTDLIVLPGETVDYVTVTVGDKVYTWDASAITFKANSRTKYKLTLSETIATAEIVDTVAEWTEAIERTESTGGETGDEFDNTDLSSDMHFIDALTAYNDYVYFPSADGASKTANLANFGSVTDYVKFSSSSKKGTATITVPAGMTNMRFFAIPWNGKTPKIVVGDKGSLQLYKGDQDDVTNVCAHDSEIANIDAFKAELGVNMFVCTVTGGETIDIALSEDTSVSNARFILFGLQFN